MATFSQFYKEKYGRKKAEKEKLEKVSVSEEPVKLKKPRKPRQKKVK